MAWNVSHSQTTVHCYKTVNSNRRRRRNFLPEKRGETSFKKEKKWEKTGSKWKRRGLDLLQLQLDDDPSPPSIPLSFFLSLSLSREYPFVERMRRNSPYLVLDRHLFLEKDSRIRELRNEREKREERKKEKRKERKERIIEWIRVRFIRQQKPRAKEEVEKEEMEPFEGHNSRKWMLHSMIQERTFFHDEESEQNFLSKEEDTE